MRRTFAFPLVVVAVVFAFALPAVAQTTTSSSYGTPPPSGEPQASVGSASPTDVNPGDPVTFDTGDALGDCTTADVVFVRGLQDASGDQIRSDAPVTNGSLTVTFNVPSVPAGIYFVYATCTDSSGHVLQSLGVVVVFTSESPPGAGPARVQAASTGGGSDQAAPSATVPTPAAIAALQTTPTNEQALMAAASTPGATIAFVNGQLAASHRASDQSSTMTVVPALSIVLAALALFGLVMFAYRRRAGRELSR